MCENIYIIARARSQPAKWKKRRGFWRCCAGCIAKARLEKLCAIPMNAAAPRREEQQVPLSLTQSGTQACAHACSGERVETENSFYFFQFGACHLAACRLAESSRGAPCVFRLWNHLFSRTRTTRPKGWVFIASLAAYGAGCRNQAPGAVRGRRIGPLNALCGSHCPTSVPRDVRERERRRMQMSKHRGGVVFCEMRFGLFLFVLFLRGRFQVVGKQDVLFLLAPGSACFFPSVHP